MHGMLFTTINDNRLSATSLARVKGNVQLAHTAWKTLVQYG
jgi:hypothetical protein